MINKDDTTGTHSIYTVHCGLSIMFHVATMIPFTAGDEQQVERKRHLGNDIVVIVFKDSDSTPFDPSCLKSEFNRKKKNFFFTKIVSLLIFFFNKKKKDIFLVVTPYRNGNSNVRQYRIAFAIRTGAKVVPPELPFPSIFEKNDAFRHWMLTKRKKKETKKNKI